MTKVEKIYVKNLRQIDEQSVVFNWCTAIITGGNNKGKSTLLKSIVERLRGDKSTIIKDWKQSGEAKREFTDWSILEWDLLWSSDKITYTTKEWVKTSSIKTICDKLFGKWFDIDEFLTAQPKEQKRIMQQLVWLDFTELDEQYEKAYNDRKEKNAIYRMEQAKISDVKEVIVSGEYKDITDLQEKLIAAEKNNEQIESIKEKIQYKSQRLISIDEEIKRLQEEKQQISDDIDKWQKWLNDTKVIDTVSIREEIEAQKAINAKHDENKKFKELSIACENARVISDEADEKVKAIENAKLELIKSANMPKWFDFSETGLLFNWYPLDKSHLSSSQIYIASLMLASMNLWEVKTLVFDASYLDKNSLNEIETRANGQWLQLLIERPDFDGWEIKYEIIE